MVASVLSSVVKQDLAVAVRQRAELVQPIMFFVLVVTLFPIAVGPSPETLQRIGGGIIWVAAILALLMGMERLFRDEYNDGTLEHYRFSPCPFYLIVSVKVITHWFVNIMPLLLVSPILVLFLNMTPQMYWALVLTLVFGTPLVSFVGAIGVALTLSLNRGGVLLALLLLPIFIPLLIFATSAIDSASMNLAYHPQIAIIAAMMLCAVALCPIAITYSLKVSQN